MTTTRFSDYELGETLGQGGMATVWLATHRPTGEVVALKRMLPHMVDSELFVARFQREVALSARVLNPHVVTVQGFGQDEQGGWFLALEYCDAGTLVSVLKLVPRVPAPLVALMLDQLLAGLEAAHALGIIHRDLKPPNILLTRAGLLKISDFGIARSFADQTLTATGEVIGTPAYMSPEQALGERELDGRSDLFSIGMLAYRMLVGSNPYASDNVATSILRVTTGPDLKLGDALQTVPPLLEGVIDGLVVKDRQGRLASATVARQLLAPIVTNLRERYPNVLARFIEDPVTTAMAVTMAAAADEIAAARACLGEAPARAVVHAARAQALNPSDLDASSIIEKLSTLHGFQLKDSNDVRIAQARAELDQKPDDPVLLRKLANLYRGAQNPLEAARFLKRFLALRPDDAMARRQLEELLGADDVAALTLTRKQKPSLQMGDILQGVKTGGFASKPSMPAAVVQPARSSSSTSATRGFGAPVVLASGGPAEGMSVAGKVAFATVVVVVLGGGMVAAGSLLKKSSNDFDKTLHVVETKQANMLDGFVDGTQAPFVERAHQAARLADWQGVIETTNFGLSADPDMRSRTTPTLVLLRARARQKLGDHHQAVADARLAQGLAPEGSAERREAAVLLASLEGMAPPVGPPAPGAVAPGVAPVATPPPSAQD